MTMVVRLGVEGLCHDKPERRVAILEALVKGGISLRLREAVVGPDGDDANALILEVTPTATTYLADKTAARIRADLAKAMKAASYDSYSWDELEQMGAYNIQDLSLPLDGPKGPSHVGSEFEIDDNLRVGLIDIPASARNWPKRSLAYKLHWLAAKHRLIVHSA